MKLVNVNYGIELKLEENIVNVLVVEHSQILSQIINELYQQCKEGGGDFVLSRKEKIYKINKEMALILEPFTINCNERKIVTRLYEELKLQIDETMIEETVEFNSKIIEYIENVTMKVPYMTTFQFEYDIKGLFKLLNVQLEHKGTTLCENIINYLKALKQLCGYNTVVFLNLKSFLSKNNLISLYEFAFYNKINLILIENVIHDKIKEEKVCIIDKDKCIIYP